MATLYLLWHSIASKHDSGCRYNFWFGENPYLQTREEVYAVSNAASRAPSQGMGICNPWYAHLIRSHAWICWLYRLSSVGSAGPRVIRVEVQEGWTRVQEQIIDEDGSGFAVITTERFELQFHSGDEGCSLFRTCTESRQVIIEHSRYFSHRWSWFVNKKIRFGQSDIVVIDKPHVLESNWTMQSRMGSRFQKLSQLSHTYTGWQFSQSTPRVCADWN